MNRERGAALLLVLLLVALLAVMVLEFQRQARVDIRAAENLHDDVQAHALLRSGSDVAQQVLAIYAKNSIADMKSSATLVKGGELLWKFLFEGEPIAIPVPSQSIEGAASLRAQLRDLYGRFPLGALVGQGVEPRRTVFKYYLSHVKEYLLKGDDKTLETVETDELGQAIIDYLSKFEGAKTPIENLAELYQVPGLTPEVVRAISPFLDVRKEWKFNANGRCVPLIMTMQTKTLEEASEIREALKLEPIKDDKDLPNAQELGGLSPEFANSLSVKTSRVDVLLEAEVRGGRRRARAVFDKAQDTQGGQSQASRFRLVEWVEGWVDDEVGTIQPTKKSEETSDAAGPQEPKP